MGLHDHLRRLNKPQYVAVALLLIQECTAAPLPSNTDSPSPLSLLVSVIVLCSVLLLASGVLVPPSTSQDLNNQNPLQRTEHPPQNPETPSAPAGWAVRTLPNGNFSYITPVLQGRRHEIKSNKDLKKWLENGLVQPEIKNDLIFAKSKFDKFRAAAAGSTFF